MDSQYYINHLGLSPHPEGGFFKEVYRSSEQIEGLPARYKGGARAFSTSIYFLLNGAQKSHFHRIQSDETWHFYAGSPLRLHQIDITGQYQQVLIGSDLVNGQVLQYTVPKNVWFAAEVIDKEEFGLVGCTVAPGFDFADFELAKASDLERICPKQTVLIKDFCID